MSEVIARCVPRVYYWFLGLLLFPIAVLVFLGLFVFPVFLAIEREFSRELFLLLWPGLTVLLAGITYYRDYQKLCYELYVDRLSLGRGASTVVIYFDQIQSIVLGLPDRLPWWIRIQKYNPKSVISYSDLLRIRRQTILLRLVHDQYLPINFNYSFLAGGKAWMESFLLLVAKKVVSAETYSAEEAAALASAKSNILLHIRKVSP